MFVILLVMIVIFLLTRKGGMLYHRAVRLLAQDATPDPVARAQRVRRDDSAHAVDATASGTVADPAGLAWTALDDLQLDRLLKESSP